VADNAFNYSINQSAKEALYVPTNQAVKYRAKGFIDIFVQRFAKTLGVGINLTVPSLVGTSLNGVRYLSFASLGLLGVWLCLAAYAGREFNRRTKGDNLEVLPPRGSAEELEALEEDYMEAQVQSI
jgi:AAA family ATP:ADP antiporter